MARRHLLLGLLWLCLCRPLAASPSQVLEMRLAPYQHPPAGTALAVQWGSGSWQRLSAAWQSIADIDPLTELGTIRYALIIDQWSALHAGDQLLSVEYRLRPLDSPPP